jgi:histidinol-phosphate phosphatase family protein
MRAVIIAGGFGTRAHALTGGRIPKALLPVGGVPIVFRQMRVLAREGVRHVTVLAGHLGDQLAQPLAAEAASLGMQVVVRVEEAPLGTAGSLAALSPADDTLIVYGDMLFDLALAPLAAFHQARNAAITVVAHPNDHPRTSDLVAQRDGLITGIFPKSLAGNEAQLPSPREPSRAAGRGAQAPHAGKDVRESGRPPDLRNLVPAGIYLAAPEFFARIPGGKNGDLIRDVLPDLLASGATLGCYATPEYLRDVGSPARHAAAERDLAAGRIEAARLVHKRPAIFFDCDGVLNEEPGLQGALRPDDVVPTPGAGEAVKAARDAGFLTIAVTNRPQVARGDISFADLDRILGRLETLLADKGGVLDRIYVCPHHPEAGFPGEKPALKIACECRKPGALLFRRAMAELPVEAARSASIGDSLRDIGAARAAGVFAYGVRTGHGCRDAARYPGGESAAPVPDLMFADVAEAVAFATSYASLAAPVLAAIEARRAGRPAPLMVGIAGPSRSGKSVLAHATLRALRDRGERALHVRLDDWIVPAGARAPDMTAEARNRVDLLPELVGRLRAGQNITSPGYDAASRAPRAPVVYDPKGAPVVLLDGVLALHPNIRPRLDLAVFVAPASAERARFAEFYRWKGFGDAAIEELWAARRADEQPLVEAQRSGADLVLDVTVRA